MLPKFRATLIQILKDLGKDRHTPEAIQQCDAIFRFSPTDNLDRGCFYLEITKRYVLITHSIYISFTISFHRPF